MKKCICCEKETDKTAYFVESWGLGECSQSRPYCKECHAKNIRFINGHAFQIINKKLYWCYNEDYASFNDLEEVTNRNRLDYILNRSYYDVLNELGW